MALTLTTSGIASFDALLESGLAFGDNIVWVIDDEQWSAPLIDAYVDSSPEPVLTVCLADPASCSHPDQSGHIHFEPNASGDNIPGAILELPIEPGTRLVFERVDDLVARFGANGAVQIYRDTCPRLFDRGAVAYWFAGTSMVSPAVVDGIARIAQCVFEIRAGQLRIIKAEGRSRRLQGATAHVTNGPDGVIVSREHVVGRLGEGLRRTRAERNLTQAQLASIAGVTPAAISQAETGRRGLSLDTLVVMCEALQIGIDDLMGTGRGPDPQVARRDRLAPPADAIPLFDDPRDGMRTFLLRIEPSGSATPPLDHRGAEMVLVADGLVLADMGDSTPVLRAGDALRATTTTLRRIINLDDREARVFWIAMGAPLRD